MTPGASFCEGVGGLMSTDSPQYDNPETPQSNVPWLWLGTVALLVASVLLIVLIVVVANRPNTAPVIASSTTPAPKAFKSLASKVTQANYDRLKLGMSQSEVEEILGPGREISDNTIGPILVWENGKTKITLAFAVYSEKSKTLFSKKIEP
jgi:hypothetical protein